MTIWFDVAIFLLLLLVGHILLGHFEDYKPKWRRILKVLLSLVLFMAAIHYVGREWTWSCLVVLVFVGILVVHCWWLPKHGINGWTGEPRQKYLDLVRRRKGV